MVLTQIPFCIVGGHITWALSRVVGLCFCFVSFLLIVLLTEGIRWPEGPPSGSTYQYRKGKETYEFIFSWISWLAVLLMGASHHGDDDGVVQNGGHAPNIRLTETCSLGLQCNSLTLEIHVMVNEHLSKGTADQYLVTISGLKYRAHRSLMFCRPLTKCWFSIESRACVRLTFWVFCI